MIKYEKDKTKEQERIKERLNVAVKEIVGLTGLYKELDDIWNKVQLKKPGNLETVAEVEVSDGAFAIEIYNKGYYRKKLKQALEKSRFKWKVSLF